jgi:hypothetical protein
MVETQWTAVVTGRSLSMPKAEPHLSTSLRQVSLTGYSDTAGRNSLLDIESHGEDQSFC